MPDKDYIYTDVKRHYRSLLDALRAKSAYSDQIVDSMGKGILKNLSEYGEKPVKLISEISKLLKPHSKKTPLERQNIDKQKIFEQLEMIVADSNANKRAKAFVKEGAVRLINKLPTASQKRSDQIGRELCREYVFNVYHGDFEERIPLSLETDDNYSYDYVKKNLEAESEARDDLIEYYSKYLNRHRKVSKLRKKPVQRRKIDLDEDIGIM